MKKLLLTISFLYYAIMAFSQIDYSRGIWDICEDDFTNYVSINQTLDSRNGCRLSPHGQIRFLTVFVELEYSNPDNDPSLNGTVEWPIGQLPIWKDDLLENNTPNGLSNCSITKYFQLASSNSHIVLGDYLVAPDNGGVFKVSTTTGTVSVSSIINVINQKLGNSFLTAHGFSSVLDFDTWTTTHNGEIKPNLGNNKWDFVVFVIRNSKDPDNSTGYSSSFTSPMLGHSADACAIVCTNKHNPTQIIRHEYAHTLLGGNNFHSGGGGFGHNQGNYWIPQTGGWGALSLYGCSLWTWSAWDRYRLGWTGAGNQFEISARDQNGNTEVNGDLDATNPTQAGVYTLRDFVTTGDALRIKLPFVDENEEYPEWIWVENHQGFDNNECEFDRWQYDDGNHLCIEGMVPGMMLYIQINNERRTANESTQLYTQDFHADYTRPILANGHWDLLFLTDSVPNNCVNYDPIRPFIRYKENPLTGANDQDHYTCDIHGDNHIDKRDQLRIWTEKTPDGILHRHLYSLGHHSHVFTLQGNHKIGMGTNPSTATQINMVGEDNPYTAAKNLRTTYLNGVSIEMIEQCPNGDIRVRIRFDDVDIENDTRWCSHDIQLSKINKDGFSLNLQKNKTILLDQGLNATRMNSPIQFDGQSIFASPTVFTVQPEVKMHLDSASRLILENASELYLRNASTCVVEDAGVIEVKNGTIFQMDECALLEINGNGKLIVRSGAELRISPSATLAFQNGLQNLIMENGVIIPNGFVNPQTLINNTISNVQINGAVTWNGLNKNVNGQIIIQQGASLSIVSSVLHFINMNSGIIINPGGKLIVDNSVLTNLEGSCSNLWQGIEVWGNKNTHQYAVNGGYGQGYVELKNGATIENAVCALNLWRPNYWSYTGGIVHATDAVFRNNHRSVHALYYKNYHPTNLRETDYNATFRRCQFIVNENYLGDEDHVFHKHVDLSHVRGFKFYACDFSVTAPSSNISYWTSGIAGNEAGFLVKGVCDSYQIPCSNYNQCTFTGFFTAINAVSDGSKSAPAITVRQTLFDNNDFGIYMRKLSNASILFSDFDVKRQDNWLCGAGIFSESMFNFAIEENEFKKDNTFNGNGIGVYIKNSDLKNTIYNNLFMNLYCGNLAIGKNIEGVGYEHLGLDYLCNTNIGNNIDFYVLKEPDVYSGIQINQGSALAAARNTFSENGYHFYNGGDFIVSYYYYNVPGFENERPLYFNSDKFFPIPTDQTSGCPSHYSGTAVDTVVISPERRQQLEQEYYDAYNTYHSLKTIYEQHVDGGNTQNELNDITTATPSDMWALRAQLLNHSPFLSGKVLETSADHPNVLPEPVLFEILISNPDELKKDSLMNYLENKDNPLPQDKINMLRQIANGTTAKTVMQTQMAASKRDFSRAAGEIIRSLVNDTIFNVAEYREWLTNMEDINADHEIIATYVDEGDFTTALALADMLPSLYGLTGTDLAEHQDYKDLLMLYRDWYNDGRNAMQMNNTERAIVEHIADYSTGIPQMMARTLLEESTGESDAENSFACVTLTLPEGGQGRGNTFTQEDFGKAMGMNVSVKPNPATTWTAVDYTLPAKMAQATIRVTNALGVTVMTAELNGNQGQKVLDLRNLADGVYVYTISCGEYVQTGKLVIAK